MNKTIFCDIDGTLLKHHGGLYPITQNEAEILPNVIDAISVWKGKDYKIILTTGRPESMRELTVEQLSSFGIFYDILIMGLPRGERIVINDSKPNGTKTATAINIERNKGLTEEHFLI